MSLFYSIVQQFNKLVWNSQPSYLSADINPLKYVNGAKKSGETNLKQKYQALFMLFSHSINSATSQQVAKYYRE